VLALPDSLAVIAARPDVFVAALGDPARDAAFVLVRDLRRAGLNAQFEYEGRSLKSQMKRADRLKAPIVFLLGEDELAKGEVTVKQMATSTQESITRETAVDYVRAHKQRS
jgi:histidyl-tRNA synthetase